MNDFSRKNRRRNIRALGGGNCIQHSFKGALKVNSLKYVTDVLNMTDRLLKLFTNSDASCINLRQKQCEIWKYHNKLLHNRHPQTTFKPW